MMLGLSDCLKSREHIRIRLLAFVPERFAS
jgi:hypothetical protein